MIDKNTDALGKTTILKSTHTVKWYQIEQDQLKVRLNTDFEKGLSSKRVLELQKRYGKNILTEKNSTGLFGKFAKQFKNPLVLILLIAGVATVFLGEYLDTTVIFIALFINIIIGTFQEERASRAFLKLKESQEKYATVYRDGRKKVVGIEELVAGDIVSLEAGMSVPADIRIIEETDLSVNESVLTGEWVSVEKTQDTLKDEIPMVKQTNMVWMGTLVSAGFAKGVVVEIGNSTEFGSIAETLTKKDKVRTPIQKSIHRLAVVLSYVVIFSVIFIFALGLLRGEPLVEMVLIAIAIAVSVVPEGLPAAVTVVLAIGMEKILSKGGLVRNLLAAETLGGTTVILTDKTGTLTQAKMKLSEMIPLEALKGECSGDEKYICAKDLLRMAVLSSDAFIEEDEEEGGGVIVRGRPIEKAIITEGLEMGLSQEALAGDYKRLDFLAFSSINRFAISLNIEPHKKANRLYFSGSPEHILAKSSFVLYKGEKIEMTDEIRDMFSNAQIDRGNKSMRMIAVGYEDTLSEKIPRDKEGKITDDVSDNLVFTGILVFIDPIREDVKASIQKAKEAGARVIMVTGDNPVTARSIAKLAGIAGARALPIIGEEVERMSDDELLKALSKHNIFARVLPKQKLRIVNILRNSGEIVAMTGDGINDAPALRSADIGIAVGSGTEVAKEASDLVLLDNSFSIIVSAIEEGRRIIANLKRTVSHLVSTSFGEIFLIIGALAFGVAVPILPAQILWVNIVEGGLLNFAFAFEPPEKDIMKINPNINKHERLITKDIKILIFTIGTITGIFTLALYLALLSTDIPLDQLRTMMFVTLSFDSIFFLLSLKSFKRPIWKINMFSNKFLILSLFMSIATLLIAIFITPLRNLLQLTTLHGLEILVLFFVAGFNLFTIEVAKYYIFERKRRI